MPTPEPASFADEWVRAWNDSDVEAVLAHFADDVVFTSPTAARVVPDSAGVVRGKQALRDYWTAALQHAGGVHFTLLGVYAGVDTIVINFRNAGQNASVCEVLTFEDGLVTTGHAAHLRTD